MANINSDAFWGLIEGSTDDDTITLTGKGSTIQSYRGNDLIELGKNSWTGNNLVYAGAGNDTIKINSSATVYGDAGADYFGVYGIQGVGGNLILDGGAGADYFYLDTSSLSKYLSYTISNTTITGGDGSDTVRINPAVKNISAVITDFSADDVFVNDTDDVAGEFLTYSTTSNGVVLQDSDPNTFSVTLKGVSISDIANAKYVYDGGSTTFGEIFGISGGGVSISNYTPNTVINGSDYDDTITNLTGGYNSTIYAGAGNDSIREYSFSNKIYGGAGNDTILNVGESSTLDGGAGNDFIYVASGTAGKNTIYGGAGNDIISLGGGKGSNGYYSSDYGGDKNLIIYNSGDGNDIIYNFYNTDTLQVAGAKYTTTTSGNNLIVGVGNSSITLSGVTSANIKGTLGGGSNSLYIEGTSGADNITNTLTGATINALAGNDTVYNTGDSVSINGGDGNDSIVNDVSGSGSAGSKVTIFGGNGNDFIANDNTYGVIDGGADADTINNYGYYTSINAGAGNDSILVYGSYSTIYAGTGNDTINNNVYSDNVWIDAGAGDDYFTLNFGRNSTLIGGEGNDTIGVYKNGYSNGQLIYSIGGANSNLDGGNGNDFLETTAEYVSMSGGAGVDTIRTWGIYGTINGGAGNDSISLSSESSNNLIQYANGEGNDIIYGLKSTDTLQISGSSYTTTKSGSNLILGVGSGKITVSGGANVDFTIDGTLESEEEDTLPAGWKFTSTLATATLSTADDLDLNEDYGANIKNVNASITSGGVVIIGNDLNNSIRAGKGADLIYDGGGNDTVSLGAGADTYIYSSGNDLIQDYATVDVIQIDTENGVEVTNIETVSSNVVIETSEGNITLKSGKGKNIALVDSDGADIEINPPVDDLYIAGTSGADNISNTLAEATIDALAGNDNISNEADNVSISGGAGRDKITNDGYYTTINGGAGVDTIENYGDYNIYQYASGDGNDTIIGFTENDTLTITSGNYSYSISGSDFVVKVGSSTIKLVDAANKIIHINNEEIPPVTSDLPEGWKYGTSSKTRGCW